MPWYDNARYAHRFQPAPSPAPMKQALPVEYHVSDCDPAMSRQGFAQFADFTEESRIFFLRRIRGEDGCKNLSKLEFGNFVKFFHRIQRDDREME